MGSFAGLAMGATYRHANDVGNEFIVLSTERC
jgi:hypothetical protein